MSATPSVPCSSAGPGLQQVLLSISRQAELDLQHLSSGDPHLHIHALRVRMKKLRAILRLIKSGLAPATLMAIQRNMRVLKHAFALNRDQHVLHALLVEFSEGAAISQEQGECLINLPSPAKVHRLQSTARRLTHLLTTMTLRPLTGNEIAQAYARRYAKARRWFRRCQHKPSASLMHRWRAPVKDHYFQSLLLLRDQRHLSSCRKLGSWLGQMHDLAILLDHRPPDTSGTVAPAIRRRMKHLRARIFRKARHLFELSPGKLARRAGAAL
jgi:hypothetical protein